MICKSQIDLNWQHLPCGFPLNNVNTDEGWVRNCYGPKGAANLSENEIKAMVEETEARKHNVFSGFSLLYHRLDLFEPAI